MSPSRVGILEWFRVCEEEAVEQALHDIRSLGVHHLRTGISWADWLTPEGENWYSWLLPRLAKEVEVLPCFLYTPPSMGIAPKTSSPPRDPKAYADWLDVVVGRYGQYFEYVELWNEPNNQTEWDWTIDQDWHSFVEMIGCAGHWMKQLGKKTVLGGMSPIDPNFVRMMSDRGVLQFMDVVGIHGFPTSFTPHFQGWEQEIARIQSVLDEVGSSARIWITETGHSTLRNDGFGQADALLKAMEAPTDRVYWYGLRDLGEQFSSTSSGFHVDERDYHFGLKTYDGKPKPLFRLWAANGLQGLEQFRLPTPNVTGNDPVTLITGGSGFVGVNVADAELEEGRKVVLYDNLSRAGVEHNYRWMKEKYGDKVELIVGDVRDKWGLREALKGVSRCYHFAAQVAVTTSLEDPIEDFDINARGTLNLLEEIRRLDTPPTLLFTSTNKVYGELLDVPLQLTKQRYEPKELVVRSSGINEERPLDFHSPYGCSKGTADQYVIDYARSYGLPNTVFRMSCIYGPHQFGTEDQGWVAFFLIRALENKKITLYGDGMQVRDILFAPDLVRAMRLAHENIEATRGNAYNIGGGAENTTSLLELLDLLGEMTGEPVDRSFGGWRTGDQRYYVSDTSLFTQTTGWKPRVGVEEGVYLLCEWLLSESPTLQPSRSIKKRVVKNARNITLR